MDPLFHLLINYTLTNNIFVAIGGLIPDFIYFTAVLMSLFSILVERVKTPNPSTSDITPKQIRERYESLKQRYSSIWSWGERMHSFFILPPVLFLAGFFNPVFMLMSVGSLLHILFDVISHKTYGPRYFWPLKDGFISMGIIQWEEHPFLIVFSWVSIISIIGLRLIMEI